MGYGLYLFQVNNTASTPYLNEATAYLAREIRADKDASLIQNVSLFNGVQVSTVLSSPVGVASNTVQNLYNDYLGSGTSMAFNDSVANALKSELRGVGLGKAESVNNSGQNEAMKFVLFPIGAMGVCVVGGIVYTVDMSRKAKRMGVSPSGLVNSE